MSRTDTYAHSKEYEAVASETKISDQKYGRPRARSDSGDLCAGSAAVHCAEQKRQRGRAALVRIAVFAGRFSVLSVWWVIFGVREYFEADGCEVLFLHNRRGFLPDAISFYLLFAVSAAPFYIIMNAVAGISLFAFLRLLLSGIFCFGLVYFLMFLTHSTAITLMTLFIYSLGGMLIYRSHPIFPFCYDLNNATAENCLEFYLPLALIGVLLIAAGQIVISKNTRYHQ